MHDANANDDVLGLALSTLATYLSMAPAVVRDNFAQNGGYAALEGMLCRRQLSVLQQRACAKSILAWLSPPAKSDVNDNGSDAHYRQILVLLLRLLEVCEAEVRLEAVRNIKALVRSLPQAAARISSVSGWADLLLGLVQGVGGEPTPPKPLAPLKAPTSLAAPAEGGTPSFMSVKDGGECEPHLSPRDTQVPLLPDTPSTPQEGRNWLYDEVIHMLCCVVEHRLRHGKGGWKVLRHVLAALSRLRLAVDGGETGVAGGDGGDAVGGVFGVVEELEQRLAASARLLMISALETLHKMVGSMTTWNGVVSEASSRPQAVDKKEACDVREEVGGTLVVVHVFLLSRFTEEQRRSMMAPNIAEMLPVASTANASGILLLLRAMRMRAGGGWERDGGGGGAGAGGGGVWLDKTIVSEALMLLNKLASLPNSPHVLNVNDLCNADGGGHVIDAPAWPAAALFLSICMLHNLIGRVPDALEGVVLADLQMEVVMCCETLMSRCAWTSEGGPGGGGFHNNVYPFASFAVNVARQYSMAYAATRLQYWLSRTALELSQHSYHQDIYTLTQKAQRRSSTTTPEKRSEICEHHRVRTSCAECVRSADVETAAQKTSKLLHVPLDKSLATLSDFYARDEDEEEKKERRYQVEILMIQISFI